MNTRLSKGQNILQLIVAIAVGVLILAGFVKLLSTVFEQAVETKCLKGALRSLIPSFNEVG